jgi:hypothetical protein
MFMILESSSHELGVSSRTDHRPSLSQAIVYGIMLPISCSFAQPGLCRAIQISGRMMDQHP